MEKTKSNTKGKDITVESEEVLDNLRDSSEEFFNKNKKVLIIAGGAILLAVAGFFGYKYLNGEKNKEGQISSFRSDIAWEKDSLNRALNGNPKSDEEPGLLAVSENYSGTKAGELAAFRAGVALLKEGKYEESIEQLKKFNAKDLLIQGIAYCRIGDAYLELKDYENAADYYTKAANYEPNEAFTPNYLIKLGLAQELQKKYDNAAETYNRIIVQYPTSRVASDAKKYKAKAEGLAKSAEEKK